MDGEIVIARRRQWTVAEKTALVAEIEASGGRVSVVAERYGISKSLLYNWRSACKAARAAREASGFIQLGVLETSPHDGPVLRTMSGGRRAGLAVAERAGMMEIELPDGVRVRVDSSVDAPALRRVLSAVRGWR